MLFDPSVSVWSNIIPLFCESTCINVFLLDLKGSVFQISHDFTSLFVCVDLFSRVGPPYSLFVCIDVYDSLNFFFFPGRVIKFGIKSKCLIFFRRFID